MLWGLSVWAADQTHSFWETPIRSGHHARWGRHCLSQPADTVPTQLSLAWAPGAAPALLVAKAAVPAVHGSGGRVQGRSAGCVSLDAIFLYYKSLHSSPH